jgi:4-amino-4-deoxy-L-arabinose transferase-like glycosyltransferase
VWAALAVYAVGFLVFFPSVLGVSDESLYVRQAVAFASGHLTVPETNPLTGATSQVVPSPYPIGTSLLQTPFVAVGGWRCAAILSLICLIIAVLILTRWLAEDGKSPLYALLFLGFPSVLVLGRVAMSDMPSAALLTLTMWLLLRKAGRRRVNWALAGFVAGASLLLRETNALFVAPLFIGAVLGREEGTVALILGGVVGTGLRLLASLLVFGSAFHARNPVYGWSLSAIPHNAPLYLLALTVLVPGGLIAVAFYRGERRRALQATVLCVLLFFSAYEYAGHESGLLKQLVLSTRFMIPLVPLITLAMADVVPRAWAALLRRGEGVARLLTVLRSWAVGGWVVAVCAACVLVHWVHRRWSDSQLAVVQTIYSTTSSDSALLTTPSETEKFLSGVYGSREVLNRYLTTPNQVAQVLERGQPAYLVFLERSDSDFFKNLAADDEAYVHDVESQCSLSLESDRSYTATDRLRIWRVDACRAPSPL